DNMPPDESRGSKNNHLLFAEWVHTWYRRVVVQRGLTPSKLPVMSPAGRVPFKRISARREPAPADNASGGLRVRQFVFNCRLQGTFLDSVSYCNIIQPIAARPPFRF